MEVEREDEGEDADNKRKNNPRRKTDREIRFVKKVGDYPSINA